MSTALETSRTADVSRVEEIRLAIAKVDNLAHALEATDQAKAMDVYARAKKSRDLVIEAIRLRIFAERRAGELARESGTTFRDLSKEFDVTRVQSRRWVTLAMTSDDEIEEALDSFDDREPSYAAVYQRILNGTAKRVEKDIYELRNGGYRIHWRSGGKRHTRSVHSLTAARRILLNVRGHTTSDPSPLRADDVDLSRAYSSLRVALQHVDAAVPKLSGDSRRAAERALTFMHKAEDEITAARKFLHD